MKPFIRILLGALAVICVGVNAADDSSGAVTPATSNSTTATAIFAGGCFWCVEADFEKLPGVISAESGYIGGDEPNPSYLDVSNGSTGHAEAVRVHYDPAQMNYAKLLDYFWRHIDPTVRDRQFCDVGDQYRSAIFYADDEQHRLAESSKQRWLDEGRFKRVYTQIKPARSFYRAEEYHQDYYKKNPVRYNYYRYACGRDARVKEIWGSKSDHPG